jgi:hypothetical protein
MDEFGKRRLKSKKDDIEYSLERVGTVATQLGQKLYQPDKVLRLAQPNGETIEQKLGVPGPKQKGETRQNVQQFKEMMNGRYDVIIEGGSTLPSNRWSRLQQYIEMFSAGIVDDVAVLKHSDLPDAESILQRKSMYSQMQQNIQALQQTVKDLQSEVDSARSSELRAKKDAEMTEFRSKLDNIDKDLQQMTEVYQQNLQKEEEKQRALMEQARNQQEPDNGDPSTPSSE